VPWRAIDATQYVESAAAPETAAVLEVGADETRENRQSVAKSVKIEKVAIMKKSTQYCERFK
jgi:hypothetical protein